MTSIKRLLFAIGLCLCLAPASHAVTLTTLVSFNGTNGTYPLVLIQNADGSFYGTARFGGIGFDPSIFEQGGGTIFRVTPDGVLSNLVMFDSNRANPGYMFRSADQNLYGTLLSWDGALFKLTPDGSLASFDPVTFGGTNGLNPVWLVEDRAGNLFGVTYSGNTSLGTAFKIDTNSTFATLALFDGTNGAYPGPMIHGVDGNFYGVAQSGGTENRGTVFIMTPDGSLNTLLSFKRTNGYSPTWLLQGSDGYLYGATADGGFGYGSIFKVTTNGTFIWWHFFNGTNGSFPSFLMQAADGSFYGSTQYGGPGFNEYWFSGNGTLFKITATGNFTSLFAFDGTNGAEPFWLITGDDGHLYGTTMMGGTYERGTVFRLSGPTAPVIQNPVRTNDTVVLTWNAVAGVTYRVQVNTNLAEANWNDLGGTITATNGTMSATDLIGSDPQRFYRVVLLP